MVPSRKEEEGVMGRYLDMIDRMKADSGQRDCEKSEISEKRVDVTRNEGDLIRLNRFFRTLNDLERRCPDYVDTVDWQRAVEDGRRFIGRWSEQAEALGWTVNDLFRLHDPPERPYMTYRRLSRYDATGLIWLLHGRQVTALTADIAVIGTASGGTVTFYRRRPRV
jgi:hypothetical protein